jgi:hypothetical protein
MATDPSPDLQLAPLDGEPRTIAEWVTTFHLVVVVLDPYTYESAWILDTAGRLLTHFTAADCRVGWIVTGTPEEARQFLGPWADRLLTFTDPDRAFVKACDIKELPALAHINIAGQLAGVAEGWNPDQWRKVLDGLANVMSWSRPVVPATGDPAPYAGSAALGS